MVNYEVISDSKDLVAEDTVVVCNDVVALKLEIPEEEKAVEDGEPDELEEAKKLGFFSPVLGMVHIQGALDDRFYARIYQRGDGVRFVEYCQQYKDGSFSPKMMLPQADMRIAARFDFVSKGIQEGKIRNKVAGFVLGTYQDYLGKFRGTLEEEFQIEQVLKTLLQAMPSLPVCTEESGGMTSEELYRSVISYLQDTYCGMYDSHKVYYAIDDSCMRVIADAMKIKLRDLLKELKDNNLLYITGSSHGYKTNVRMTSAEGEAYTQWMYCVYKFKNLIK